MSESLKHDTLPPIPQVETELREVAENAAGAILKCGGSIPGKVGVHVRDIDWWYRASHLRYINSYSHLSSCIYLRSLDAGNSPAKDFYFLSKLKYLESLRVGRYKVYGGKYGRGPTNESLSRHWKGVGCYEIDENPLYRRLGKKRDKPLPGFTDIEWLASLSLLKHLSIEIHNVLDFTPLSELDNLETLKLHGAKTSTLELIGQSADIKELELYNCSIEDVSKLNRFESLNTLIIERCNIGLLSKLPESLNYFRANGNCIKDLILPESLPNLSKIIFNRSEVTGKKIGLEKYI